MRKGGGGGKKNNTSSFPLLLFSYDACVLLQHLGGVAHVDALCAALAAHGLVHVDAGDPRGQRVGRPRRDDAAQVRRVAEHVAGLARAARPVLAAACATIVVVVAVAGVAAADEGDKALGASNAFDLVHPRVDALRGLRVEERPVAAAHAVVVVAVPVVVAVAAAVVAVAVVALPVVDVLVEAQGRGGAGRAPVEQRSVLAAAVSPPLAQMAADDDEKDDRKNAATNNKS